MNLIPAIQSTSDALSANRLHLEVIAQNIANAQTTRDVDGGAYQRREVLFESYMKPTNSTTEIQSVRVANVVADDTPGAVMFMPNHPHADENGMVQMPNVQMANEMVDLITASRSYEANLSVVKTSREMATQALGIGR